MTESIYPDLSWWLAMHSRLPLGRRRLLSAGAAAVLAGLAGCGDPMSGSGESVDPGEPTDQAPAGTGVLVRADTAALYGADASPGREATERLLAAYGGGAAGAADDAGLVAEFESRTGLSVADTDAVVVFADEPRGEFAAYVVDGEWSEATVASAMESATGLDYEPRDHEGGTVYEPAGGGPDADFLGDVADGRYAVGSEAAVEAAIETVRADRGSASGAVADALEDAGVAGDDVPATSVAAATDDPRAYLPPEDDERVPDIASLDVYELATVGTVAYATDGSSVAVDAELRADSQSDARKMADLTVTARSFLRNEAGEAVAAELSNVAVEQDDDVVAVSYRGDVEGAATLAGYL